MRVAPEIELTPDQRAVLTRLAQSAQTSPRIAQRARIVLLAAQGMQNKDIAAELDIGRVQVSRWRERYLQSGLAGIERDLPRGTPSALVDVERLVRLTTESRPEGAARWSTRSMAAALGISPASVSRHWRAQSLTPRQDRGLQFLAGSRQVAALDDIVGLYVAPAGRALVLSSSRMGLAGDAQDRPAGDGHQTKDGLAWGQQDLRRGPMTLFGALHLLDVRRGQQAAPDAAHEPLIEFLARVEREARPGDKLHAIVDDHAVFQHPRLLAWLAGHRRVRLHATGSAGHWLSAIEGLFANIDDRLLRPDAMRSAQSLLATMEAGLAQGGGEAASWAWTRGALPGSEGGASAADTPPAGTATMPQRARTRARPAARTAGEGDTLRDDVINLKRERILQAAARLFFERGYLQTSVDAIAERLGATKPFVYYHFHSKVDILVEICEKSNRDVLAAAGSAMSAPGSPRARLEQFLRDFTNIALEQHQMVAIYFREEISLPTEAAERIRQMRKSINLRLGALLSEGINAGEFQIEDPRMGALVIAGMASYAFAWYREGGRLDRQEVTNRIVKMALKLVSATPYHRPAYRIHSVAGG